MAYMRFLLVDCIFKHGTITFPFQQISCECKMLCNCAAFKLHKKIWCQAQVAFTPRKKAEHRVIGTNSILFNKKLSQSIVWVLA